MAQYILANRIYFQGVDLRPAKVIDDAVYDISFLIASGAVLVPIPNAQFEARAEIVRREQARGRSETELDELAAAFAEDAESAQTTGPLTFAGVRDALALADSSTGFNGRQLVNVADPTTPQAVATKAYVDALELGEVPDTRQVVAGAGMTGGGDLSTDRTLNVVANADGSIVVNANDLQVGALATDGQHGNRGGGGVHALAIASGASGFTSGADKAKLDGVAPLAAAVTSSAPANVDKSAAAVGVGVTSARSDHKHDVSTSTPVSVAIANAEGAASTLARSDHTHNLPFSPVQTALNGATGAVGVNNNLIQNVSTPVSSTDAATKGYVDGLAAGLVPHAACVVVVTSNIVLVGAQTIDGVGVVAGNRVLVAGQTLPLTDGIYVAAVGAWSRAADLPTGSSAAGAFVFISMGTANNNTGWTCTNTPGSDVVDTDALTFQKFSTVLLATSAPPAVSRVSSVVGGSSLAAREDHNHDVSTAAPVAVAAANVEGVLATIARSDHVHDHGAQTAGTHHAVAVASGANGFLSGADKAKLDGVSALAAALTAVAPTDVTKSAAVTGVSGTAARSDHKHDVSTAAPGTTAFGAASEGVAASLARSDHGHALTAPGAPANVTKSAASAGASGNVAREDHKHDVTTASASTIGTANAEGAATSLARSDHVHNHGVQTDGTQHAVAVSAGANGFLSGADKALLDALVAAGANKFVQSLFNEIAVDTTTVSATFVSLLTQAITIAAGGVVIVHFTGALSSSSASASTFFELRIDGVTQRSVGTRSPGGGDPQSFSMVRRITGLAAGARTVEIRWRTTGGTARIRPVTAPDAEHLALLVEEVKP